MTAATLHADAAPARQGWRSLLWIIPLTALWVGLTYSFPIVSASGVQTVAVRVFIPMLLALGLWLGLERTELTPGQRRNFWLAVLIPYTLWLAVIWSGAVNGLFLPRLSPVPLLPLAIFLPVIIGTPILLFSKRMGQVLDAMPTSWLIALQLYRVFGGVFLVGWARNVIPGVFALPAGIGDVITGLLAVPIAISVAADTPGARRAAVAWNVFGLFDFAVAVSIGLMIAPGPLQLIVPNIPNTTAGVYPNVMIPAFAVPSSILLHALSLRQLRRRNTAALSLRSSH
jgi:hypothetical protein